MRKPPCQGYPFSLPALEPAVRVRLDEVAGLVGRDDFPCRCDPSSAVSQRFTFVLQLSGHR